MIKPILEALEPLVVDELYRANLTNPQFHSPHEGWAVIYEEVTEARSEMDGIESLCDDLRYYVFTDRFENANEKVKRIRSVALRLAAEAIQVAAMCDKWRPYGEKEKSEKE